ncbi:MAG: tRNA (cytidine(34)-2'-O)-methyltransferase [Hydrogenibacillus schlegelii]|nr:tRNA (cytidine(34)-2'-O)-methyltransferase [Hydrogenibacillus schlegelii]
MPFHIVLVEPEIPPNTGNVARTCAVTGATLGLVHPLGFSLEDRYLRRAGLDYWPEVRLKEFYSLDDVYRHYAGHRFFYFSAYGKIRYTDVRFRPGDVLVFGKETTGLPEDVLRANAERVLRIPMRKTLRSLNLSNAVAIVLYEALRQNGFPDLV